jgi:spermidine/putrescine transport system ATP-binding protein
MQLELKRIQREVGITFVLVTHDQNEALTMSDRIAVMSDGVIEQVGTPEEIYHRPATLFVAGFIGSANLLPGTAAGRDGGDVVVELECGYTIRVARSPTASREPAAGDPVSVMIRPERVTVAAPVQDAEGDGRSLEGVARSFIFQGSQIRLDLVLVDGTGLVAWIDPDDDLPPMRPGSTVNVTWKPGAAFLLNGWPASAGANDTNVDHIEAAL